MNKNNPPQTLQSVPHCLEVEQAFLAGLMENNSKYYDVMDIVKADHFFNMLNAKVFTAIGKLINSGKEASAITLVDFMANDSVMVDINGVEFLAHLSGSLISTMNLVSYAEQIRDFYVRRAIIQTGREMIENASKPSVEVSTEEVRQDAEQKIFAIGNYTEAENKVSNAAALMHETLQSIERAYQTKQGGEYPFLDTDIDSLDKIIGGIRPHNLIIVGAPTATGKTAFSVTLMLNLAKKGKSVLFASLEMSKAEIGERILSQETGRSAINIGNGDFDNQSMNEIIEYGKRVSTLGIHVDDAPQLSLASLRSKSMKIKRSGGLDAIFVDYLQLMGKDNGEKSLDRVSKISRGLKGLAKELNVPVIALAQLSREFNKREDKRPQLSDLRESGTIEQDADVVLFLYREHDVLEAKKPETGTKEYYEWLNKLETLKDVIEIIVAKNRRGGRGKAIVKFAPQIMRIS